MLCPFGFYKYIAKHQIDLKFGYHVPEGVKKWWIATILPFFPALPSKSAELPEKETECDANEQPTNEHLDNLKKSIMDDDLLFWKNDWWKNITSGNGTGSDWERLMMYIFL